MLNQNKDTARRSLVGRMLRIEWLGQTVASVCWIISVFAYGLESTGDYLQLTAASAWFIANASTLAPKRRGSRSTAHDHTSLQEG
ncbi:MAG TPA: hypothetical protein DEO57_06190 [Phycisphaerales bacterium]|nr:hypothetical protein [Phycisphaerales bacterium]|tara:strand:- start:278 stop:532 length:255 start_codon:yes stop_codon:yes gene_type:complete